MGSQKAARPQGQVLVSLLGAWQRNQATWLSHTHTCSRPRLVPRRLPNCWSESRNSHKLRSVVSVGSSAMTLLVSVLTCLSSWVPLCTVGDSTLLWNMFHRDDHEKHAYNLIWCVIITRTGEKAALFLMGLFLGDSFDCSVCIEYWVWNPISTKDTRFPKR